MDISPFSIRYNVNGQSEEAEVRPCCREDNVVDYAIWQEGKLAFTVTMNSAAGQWVIAMKNADDDISPNLIQQIGNEINKHYERVTG